MTTDDDRIFLTGFPGFIAGRLVRRLAASGARFELLVQPALLAQAENEIRDISRSTNRDAADFRIVSGDITAADLGMNGTEASRIRDTTTIVFHLAALYDLGVGRDLAMQVNVEGTRHVNRFVAEMSALRHYHYVSTCYVAGKRTGMILETELEHNAGFRNHYEETKYLAELETGLLKARLPITIHRPSVVCGDSRTGETAKYDGIYYLINYLRRRPGLLALANIGNPRVRLNIVPVDFVVDSLAALAHDERAIGATLQLADPAPLTTAELFEQIARALTSRGPVLRIPAPLVRTTLDLPFTETLTGMPRVAVPYFFIEQEYDSTRASWLLAPHGIKAPSFGSYVGNLIAYVARTRRQD